MRVVYIAGPFRAATAWAIEQNIRWAEKAGLKVAECGAMPIIPHANTRYFHGLFTEQFWIDGTMEILRRCDGILVLVGWEESKGTMNEIEEAKKLGMPIWYEEAYDCYEKIREFVEKEEKCPKRS